MKKYIITAFLAFGIFSACVIPVHAASASSVVSLVKDMFGVCLETVNSGEDDWIAARNQINSHWLSYSSVSSMGRLYLSYDVMSNLAAELNGQGFPCRLEYNRNLQLYVICGVGEVGSVPGVSVTGLYLTNGSRDLFCCEYNTDSLLSSISSTLTTKLTTLTNGVASIYTKLSSIDDSVVIGTGTLNNIYNYLTGDLTTYLQSIDSSVSGSETFLGQINSKLDTIISKMTTGSGVTDFSSITSRLDSILASMGSPEVKSNFPVWRLNNDSISDLTVSDVGYDALSSLCATVTSDYLNYQVTDGSAYFYLDTINSLDLVHTTVGGHTGYFIQVDGTYRQSVDGVNQFFDGILYLSERNGTLFYASDASRASAGASVSLSSDALYTNFGTIGQLAQAYQGGTLDPSTTFPTLNAVVVGLLGLAQKIDAVDLNPKVEVVVKEAEYTVNHFTDVVVDSSSDIYNVFYLTDEDGNQTSVGRVAADSLGASGKLLQFLFKFCVDGALSGVDGSMDSLNDFYFDNAESSFGEGVSIWD